MSYIIEAGSASGLANLANVATNSTATTFSAGGVANGTYFVRVKAQNAAGTSAASNEALLQVGFVSRCTPTAPSGLAASVIGGTVTLSWNDPAPGCDVTTYIIEAGSTSGASNLAQVTTGNTSRSFVANSVPVGTYYIRVRAANTNGSGPASNEIVATVTGTTSGTTTTWVGLTANGDGLTLNIPGCGGVETKDMTIVVVQNGSAVTGTATNKVTQTNNCDKVLGKVEVSVFNGTLTSGILSVSSVSRDGTITLDGVVTATRMSGTVSFNGTNIGTFAANKQ